MADQPTEEGHIPFTVPSLDNPCQTHYKIYGNLHTSKRTPLVILHGGPGSGHEYLLPFTKLWTRHGIPLLFYDQIGCAGSTHLRDKAGDYSFWQIDLFVSELENTLKHFNLGGETGTPFDLLGHSFGGMMSIEYAAKQPRGLRRMILSGTPASVQLFMDDADAMLSRMSAGAKKAIEDAMREDVFAGEAYSAAMGEWSRTFWCRADPWPGEALKVNLRNQADDQTVRGTMMGRGYFATDGSLQNWTGVPLLPRIQVSTLLYNGEWDLAHESAVKPLFDNIPRVRWVVLPNASHMHHIDTPELEGKVMKLVWEFLYPEEIGKGV